MLALKVIFTGAGYSTFLTLNYGGVDPFYSFAAHSLQAVFCKH